MNFTSERMRCFTKHNVYIPLFSVGPQTAAAAEQVVGSVAITRKTLHTAYQTVKSSNNWYSIFLFWKWSWYKREYALSGVLNRSLMDFVEATFAEDGSRIYFWKWDTWKGITSYLTIRHLVPTLNAAHSSV